MAIIYPKDTVEGVKNMLVLDPRQALIYPFDVGDWNTIRFGAIISFTTSGDYNADLGGDSNPYLLSRSTPYNEYYLGLKRQGTGFATTDSDYYVGLRSSPDDPDTTISNGALFGRASFGVYHKNGTTGDMISTFNASFTYGAGVQATGSSSFSTMFSYEFKVFDKGLPTQYLEMRSLDSLGYTVVTNNVSKEYIYQELTHGTYAGGAFSSGKFGFNLSNVPYELPNAFFFYIPQVNARLRIHNLGVIKVD